MTTHKFSIGLIGPDSSGEKLGRQAKAIFEGLQNDFIVVVSYNGSFSALHRLHLVIYAGKHISLHEEVIKYCDDTRTPLVCVGDEWKDVLFPDDAEKQKRFFKKTGVELFDHSFVCIWANNMSLKIAGLKALLKRGDQVKPVRLIQLIEFQQEKKQVPTETAKSIVHIGGGTSELLSYTGVDALMQYGIHVPDDYKDDFAVYFVTVEKTDGERVTFQIEIFGREDYVNGARALCNYFTGPYQGWLDRGKVFSFQYVKNVGDI